ncbi:Cysteine-rich receptor-like protein kinase 10 [Linum perenne]
MNSLFLALLLLILPSQMTSQPDFITPYCSNHVGNYTAGSTFGRNLNHLMMTSIATSTNTTIPGFYYSSFGQGSDWVNGLVFCRGNVGPEDCRACMRDATSRILVDCPNQKEAVGWYDFCMIRYSYRPIYGVLDPDPVTYYMWNVDYAYNPSKFNLTVGTLMTRLRKAAMGGSGVKNFATGMEKAGVFLTIYRLVQCSPDLSSQLCDDCLVEAIGQIPRCCDGKIGGRVINPNCNLRFETSRFYADSEAPKPARVHLSPSISPSPSPSPHVSAGNGASKNTNWIIAMVVVLSFILFLFCYGWKVKKSRIATPTSSQNIDIENEANHQGWLQLEFDTIRAATNNFTSGNKLGEGGFGAVYKGTLSNGQDVAVKRLAKGSSQGDLEFKTEVKFVAKLKHRNLVRLLGFCLEGRERLLVFEFMPNASLDHFLFDNDKRVHLDWERRYKIIEGIIRGLVYLHQDSQLRIIHLELKVSNILLDADMNPKISDFGMAKLFGIDETHRNTSRIVGTQGYMAPEYALHGMFSIKSDVFSFGVMVLEIVSGQKSYSFRHGSRMVDLLSYAWKNWTDGMYEHLIDPSLRNYSRYEIERCIHIGLLCVQENPNDRPTMASVALMMTSSSMSLQLPSKPAFFIDTDTNPDEFNVSVSSPCTGSSKFEVSITELYAR